MKVLGHIHTLNDEDVIDQSVQALLGQTYPVHGIVIVDNGSTDSTIQRSFPAQVQVLRESQNRGTSGAVKTGLQYALAREYDWIWILDADSLPRRDALAKLIELHESFDPVTRGEIGVLSCSQVLSPSTKLFQGRRLTPGGPRLPRICSGLSYCECDSTIWSGSMYNLTAVRSVGFPRSGEAGFWQDLSLDYGDVEFSYRIKQAGYQILVHRSSLIEHVVGKGKMIRPFGLPLTSTNHPPGRRYLFFRNLVYFWIYLYPRRNWPVFSLWFMYRFMVIAGLLVIEEQPLAKLAACIRGIRDGLRKNLDYRYGYE